MSDHSEKPFEFADPSPAEGEQEFLFAERPEFEANLRRIAQHIASGSRNATRPGMTFGLLGPWGSGKTSALNRLVMLVREELQGQRLTVTRFAAPLFEGRSTAHASLSYVILRDAEDDLLGDLIRLYRATGRLTGEPTELTTGTVLPDDFDLSQAVLFQQLLSKLEAAPLLTTELFRSARSPDAVQIVLVDDLDRCEPAFVMQVLKAMDEWRAIDNLYFVLAMSEQRLLASVTSEHRAATVDDAHVALQKYVHVTTALPPLVVGREEILSYLLRLTERIEGDRSTSQLAQLLELSARSLDQGTSESLLAPLFRTDSSPTPRELKHRFNRFLTEYRGSAGTDPALVRRWIIKAFWPDLWWSYVWGVEIGGAGGKEDYRTEADREWLSAVADVGALLQPLWGMPSADLDAAVRFLLAERGWPDRQVDSSFVVYLAQSGWAHRTASSEPSSPRTTSDQKLAADAPTGPSTPNDALRTSGDEPSGGSTAHVHGSYQDIYLQYLLASTAEDQGDTTTCVQILRNILSLAQLPGATRRSAPTVGNSALIAERMGETDLSTALHRRAMELNPTHVNIHQNFVEHVIDSELSELYDLAISVIALLEPLDEPAQKPLRTELLKSQLAVLANKPELAPVGLLGRIEDLSRSRPTVATTNVVSRYLGDDADPVLAERIYRQIADHADSSEARARALEKLAGLWAARPEEEYERLALDLFRFMISAGYGCISGGPSAWLLNWIAQLMRLRGHFLASARVFDFVVRKVGPTEYTRTSFAQLLDELGHGDLAIAVMLGHDFELPKIPASVVPESFSPRDRQWWLSYPPLGAPCEVPDDSLAIGLLSDGAIGPDNT